MNLLMKKITIIVRLIKKDPEERTMSDIRGYLLTPENLTDSLAKNFLKF